MFISCAGEDKGENYERSQYSMNKKGVWRRQLKVSRTSGGVYEEEWRNMLNGRHILK